MHFGEKMVATFIKYKNQKYVLAGTFNPNVGPLTVNKKVPTQGIYYNAVLSLKDKKDKLMYRATVDFDTGENYIWFFEDLYDRLETLLSESDIYFEFKGKEYLINEIFDSKDKNYYMVASVEPR